MVGGGVLVGEIPIVLLLLPEAGDVPGVAVLVGWGVLVGEVPIVLLLLPEAGDVPGVGIFVGGGGLTILEVSGGHQVHGEGAPVGPAGVAAPGGAQVLGVPVGQGPLLIGGGVVVVLLVLQDGHPKVRVLPGHLEVGLGELPQKPAVLGALLELVIGVSCHLVLLSHCRPGRLLRALPARDDWDRA